MLLHEHEPLASDTSLFARSGNFRTYLTFLKIFVPLVDNGLGRIFHLRITLSFYSFRHQHRLIESPVVVYHMACHHSLGILDRVFVKSHHCQE